MGVFATADGFINIGVGGDGQWHALCRSLERPDLDSDPDYATLEGRFRNRPRLTAILIDIFKQKPSADWLARLEKAGVPAGPIYGVDEVFADPQVEHLGMAVPLQHPRRGAIAVVGQPITLSRTPASVVSTLPEAGEHSTEILREAGYGDADIDRFREARII